MVASPRHWSVTCYPCSEETGQETCFLFPRPLSGNSGRKLCQPRFLLTLSSSQQHPPSFSVRGNGVWAPEVEPLPALRRKDGGGASHLEHLQSLRLQREWTSVCSATSGPPDQCPVTDRTPTPDKAEIRSSTQGRAGWPGSQPGLSLPLHSCTSLALDPGHPSAMATQPREEDWERWSPEVGFHPMAEHPACI